MERSRKEGILFPNIALIFSGFIIGYISDVSDRMYFGNSRKLFAVIIAGERIYIITSPRDVSSVYKNTTLLTFDDYIKDMMYQFGGSDFAVGQIWQNLS